MNKKIYLETCEFLLLLIIFVFIGMTGGMILTDREAKKKVISGYKVKAMYETNSAGEVTLVKTEWIKPK